VTIFPIFIPHAGCPHHCLFCAQDKSTGQSGVPDAARVFSQLNSMLPEHGDGEIAFYGGTFTALPLQQQAMYLETARQFVDTGRASGLRVSTRPDALDEEILRCLMDAGVGTVEIGCQSFSDAVLLRAGRGHIAADCIAATRRCQRAGFQVGLQLMPGLPGGDTGEALFSLHQALKLEPAFLRIYPTVVLAGTALAELWQRGDFSPFTLDAAVDICADMLSLCRREGVPVVRLGLQQDPALQNNLVAGPFHPAFGQLVRSRIWRRALAKAATETHRLSVHPHDFSDVLGHRGENRAWLKERYPGLLLRPDPRVGRGRVHGFAQDWCHDGLSTAGGSLD